MMHVYHGDLGCPEGTILYDGCEECEERARGGMEGLCTQDPIRVEAIWRRMIATERRNGADLVDDLPGYPCKEGYLTDAEARIGKPLYLLAVMLERAGDPRAFAQGMFNIHG